MKNPKLNILSCVVLLLSTIVILNSCTALKNTNKTQRGAAIGAVGGAVVGAILGTQIGEGDNGALGAVIGGAVGGVAGGVIGKRMDKQAREIETTVPGAEVERVGEGIKLVLGENSVRFNTNKSDLTTEAKANLDKLVIVFKEYANTDIMIYGYTDSTGKVDYNQQLSERRAASVKDYLVAKSLATDRFKTQGFGVADPIADNKTADGRSKNRRVEFAIIANEKMKAEAKAEEEAVENKKKAVD